MNFVDKVVELSGQNLFSCIQCGKCSGGCPIGTDMDIRPNRVISLTRSGSEIVLSSKTIWLCASCQLCDQRCPKEMEMSKVMEALRAIELRTKDDHIRPEDIPPESLVELPQIALVAGYHKYTRSI